MGRSAGQSSVLSGVAIAIYCPGNAVRACHFDAGRDKTGGAGLFASRLSGPK